MILNYEEIINAGLLDNATRSNYENASYNLSIGSIVDANGKVKEYYDLPPQGMIMVVSNEKFKLPDNIIGYTTVKNSLSISGILAINIGIVDSGYKGPIASVLINFGKNNFEIKKDATFMRMTFHEFKLPQINKTLSYRNAFNNDSHYLSERIKDSMILGNKFLYLDKEIEKFKNETKDGIIAYFAKLTAIISLILAALSFAYSTYTNRNDSDVIEKYKSSSFVINKLKVQDSIIAELKKEILKKKEFPVKTTKLP